MVTRAITSLVLGGKSKLPKQVEWVKRLEIFLRESRGVQRFSSERVARSLVRHWTRPGLELLAGFLYRPHLQRLLSMEELQLSKVAPISSRARLAPKRERAADSAQARILAIRQRRKVFKRIKMPMAAKQNVFT